MLLQVDYKPGGEECGLWMARVVKQQCESRCDKSIRRDKLESQRWRDWDEAGGEIQRVDFGEGGAYGKERTIKRKVTVMSNGFIKGYLVGAVCGLRSKVTESDELALRAV